MPNPEMRASDADRDRVAASLREHCAVGRLTTDELTERIEAVYASRTLGELAELTADLPEEDPDAPGYPVPAAQRYDRVPAARGSRDVVRGGGGRLAWSGWALVSGVSFTVWVLLAVAGVWTYPWWIWVAGPWGLGLLLSTVARRR
ncbi:DUF1707 domain-containing protein [Actinomadura rayongensis]